MKLVTNVPPVLRKTNELAPNLLSINSMNMFSGHDSASRGTMFSSSHITQALVADGATPRRIQSGVENEFGKYTFKHKMPCDAAVIKLIPKFRETMGIDSIPNEFNPTTLLVYENIETKEIGILELFTYSTAIDIRHQHFGFRYKFNPILDQLTPGKIVPKDTVLGDSPNVEGFDEVKSYNYGVETNVAFMGVPAIIEDGVVVSQSYLKRISSKGFEKRTINWGKKYFPLNLYGDKDHYKPFPDIGQKIRDDGLLFALRPYDELLAPVEMDPASLQEPDYIFDKLVYGEANGTVIDININHDTTQKYPPTPVGMDDQTNKYYQGQIRYYREILELYNDLHKDRRHNLQITPEFSRLCVEATNYVGLADNPATRHMRRNEEVLKRRVQQLYRRHDIDDWRVEVSFEYPVVPNVGFKQSNTHGGKGVICAVWPDEDMPLDADGNRAELIMDGDSIIKRMNIGTLYEQWINATTRDVSKRVQQFMAEGGDYQEAFNYLMSYYWTVSPIMAETLEENAGSVDPKTHVDYVLSEGAYIWYPTNNPAEPVDMIKKLYEYFPPTFGPVTYAPERFVTDRNVLIGSVYVVVLEKTGGDWSGVSSAKLQHFGIPARVSNADKYASPGRNQPVRILGESEVRLLNAVVGSDVTADLLDQSNSPATHKAIVNQILSLGELGNIDEIIDRREIPLGNSRSLQFVRHILECAGVEFVRNIDDPIRQADMDAQLEAMYNPGEE